MLRLTTFLLSALVFGKESETEALPSFAEISPDNFKKYQDRGLPIAWLAVKSTAQPELTIKAKNIVANIADSLDDELSFVWVDAEKYEPMTESMGIRQTPVILIKGGEGKTNKDKFMFQPPKSDFTLTNVEDFFLAYNAGTATPWIKAGPLPTAEEISKKAVVSTNANTLPKLVGQGKSVLVEFYAPWCGVCKGFAPKYEDLAQEFERNDNVVIADFDATANDSNDAVTLHEDVTLYPTLYFYPADFPQTDKIKYEGKRYVGNLVEWINQQTAEKTTESESCDDSSGASCEMPEEPLGKIEL